MSFAALSAGLADAVATVTPSLLALRGPRRVGTAMAVAPDRVVTAAHLIRAKSGPLVLPDGSTAEGEVVGAAPALDLVLVAVKAGGLAPVTWATDVRVGELVVPVAYGPRATLGLIARVGGAWQTPAGAEVQRWIEVDGSLPAGFSGGPLLGASGVIGMNTHRLVRGGTTLPADTLRAAIDVLEKRGTLEPGFLGVGAATATLTPAQAAAAGQDEALLVVAVEPGSPAEGILTVGDIVLRVDGRSVKGVQSLRGALAGLGAGHEARLDVLSALAVDQRVVKLGARPADAP
ncbi:MAG: serine protease [Alphaproteobacteria bacterium]|nr:serine protease [Alphaproteobacteria bacterium]